MTSTDLYVFDVNATGTSQQNNQVLTLTYSETIQLPVIAKKISYGGSNYMVLSLDGKVYIK